MPIDWSNSDFVFLRQQLQRGKVILFTGAGFSVGATNLAGEVLPLGGKLAEMLADLSGYAYTGEPLPIVYEAARGNTGIAKIWEVLRQQFGVKDYADWYQIVRAITWHRIYSLNIDNLLQRMYLTGSGQQLRTIINPAPYEERDSLLGDLQCVHLHGHIDGMDKGLSFTLPDFGKLTATTDVWYQQFIEDLYFRSVIFIGTQLEEPMFFHYLNLRDPKEKDVHEYRPKSYLVNRTIGPMRMSNLRDRNIVGIECTAEEFFEDLQKNVGLESLSLNSVRETAYPHIIIRGNKPMFDANIGRHFEFIRSDALPYTRKSTPEGFFMGAEADWYDIYEERDAFRQINDELLENLSLARETFSTVVLHGPAGSGKTTTLMRCAERLSAAGGQVFFAKGIERLDLTGVLIAAKEAEKNKQRVFIVIDVFGRHMSAIDRARADLKGAKNVTLILADRTNKYAQISHAVADLTPIDIRMPDLCEPDVKGIIDKLTKFGFLGELRGKTPDQQLQAFMERADKQLLVALREATSGKGFDLILQNEFNELAAPAKVAYTICCIAVAHGAPGVYLRHLMPCLGRTQFKQGFIIKDLLRGVLIPTNYHETMVKPRHRLIATWVANEIAPVGVKVEAVENFLIQISPDIIPNEIRRRSPAYIAYRGMINSGAMKETFNNDHEIILGLYGVLKEFYDKDFLFWLQYGMAQINAGDLGLAENFLNQSLSINSTSHQTKHQMGCLNLMQAVRLTNVIAAKEKADRGVDLLREQIFTHGDENSYPYHAYLVHVCRWYQTAGDTISDKQWEALRAVGTEAEKKYPRDDMIRDAVREVERQYLLRVSVERRAARSP